MELYISHCFCDDFSNGDMGVPTPYTQGPSRF
jgi:hypothetical protein